MPQPPQFILDTKAGVLSGALMAAVQDGLFRHVMQAPRTRSGLLAQLGWSENLGSSILDLLGVHGYLVLEGESCRLGPAAGPLMERGDGLAGWFEEMQVTLRAMPDLRRWLRASGEKNPLKEFWGYTSGGGSTAEADRYSQNMDNTQGVHASSVLAALGPVPYRRAAELGGGYGGFASQLVRSNPHLALTLIDLPAVAKEAAGRLHAAGLSQRIECVGKDFLRDPLPGGFDAVFLNRVVHDWPDDVAGRLLTNAARMVRPGGHVLVAENMLDASGHDRSTAATGVMLALLGGRRRAVSEIQAMMRAAGLGDGRVVRTGESMLHVVVGERPL